MYELGARMEMSLLFPSICTILVLAFSLFYLWQSSPTILLLRRESMIFSHQRQRCLVAPNPFMHYTKVDCAYIGRSYAFLTFICSIHIPTFERAKPVATELPYIPMIKRFPTKQLLPVPWLIICFRKFLKHGVLATTHTYSLTLSELCR